jgi:hypothetical protein
MIKNRVLRRLIGQRKNEVTGGWRKLHEELCELYSSPSIIRVIKSKRRVRWAGHVARMGRKGTRIGYWWESQRETDHYKYQDGGALIIVRWILER